MNKTILTALALSLALGVTAAEARQHGPKLPQFSVVDTDGNGQITEAELSALATVKFNEADTNGDGFLDIDEIKARSENMAERLAERAQGDERGERMHERMGEFVERMIERADENDDGKLSLAEVTDARPEIPFERVDTNSDGTISELEWHIAVDHKREQGRDHGRG